MQRTLEARIDNFRAAANVVKKENSRKYLVAQIEKVEKTYKFLFGHYYHSDEEMGYFYPEHNNRNI